MARLLHSTHLAGLVVLEQRLGVLAAGEVAAGLDALQHVVPQLLAKGALAAQRAVALVLAALGAVPQEQQPALLALHLGVLLTYSKGSGDVVLKAPLAQRSRRAWDAHPTRVCSAGANQVGCAVLSRLAAFNLGLIDSMMQAAEQSITLGLAALPVLPVEALTDSLMARVAGCAGAAGTVACGLVASATTEHTAQFVSCVQHPCTTGVLKHAADGVQEQLSHQEGVSPQISRYVRLLTWQAW